MIDFSRLTPAQRQQLGRFFHSVLQFKASQQQAAAQQDQPTNNNDEKRGKTDDDIRN